METTSKSPLSLKILLAIGVLSLCIALFFASHYFWTPGTGSPSPSGHVLTEAQQQQLIKDLGNIPVRTLTNTQKASIIKDLSSPPPPPPLSEKKRQQILEDLKDN